jgi:hypothetical protein
MITKNRTLDFESSKELLYKIVEKKLSITKTELFSVAKTRQLADTRRVMIKLLKINFPKAKVVVLGEIIGRDHSNVSQQLKKHDELFSSNESYTALFNELSEEFNAVSYMTANSINSLQDAKKDIKTALKAVNFLIRKQQEK